MHAGCHHVSLFFASFRPRPRFKSAIIRRSFPKRHNSAGNSRLAGVVWSISPLFLPDRVWAFTCIADSVTPISAPSIAPVSTPTAAIPVGQANAQTATVKDGLPGSTPAAGTEASALTWLMTWLGEQDLDAEGTEPPSEEAPPATAAPVKIHWLNLLPNVPAIEASVAELAADRLPESEKAPTPLTELAPTEDFVPDRVVGSDEIENLPSVPEDDSVAVAPVAQVPLTPAPVPITIPVATPVATEATATVFSEKSIPVSIETPTTKHVPELSAQERVPVRNQLLSQPAPKQADKGEVIWSAQLTVASEQTAEVVPGASFPENRQQPEPQPRPVLGAGPVVAKTPVSPLPARPITISPSTLPSPETGETEALPDPVETKKPVLSELPEREPERHPDESKHESAFAGSGHSEAKTLEGGARNSGFSAEFSSRASEPNRVNDTAPVERAAIEPATPLKPAQIATLQVDVPTQIDGVESAPMRLVVSQRGEQVNVRLRSFDTATAPIEDARMQPLLHSLAEKGLVSEWKPGTRLGESMPISVERTQEKPMVMAESSGGQNDMQSFQRDHERNQQNHERQQQQQAFFLRKQLRSVQAEEFTLSAVAEANRSAFQQGVSR